MSKWCVLVRLPLVPVSAVRWYIPDKFTDEVRKKDIGRTIVIALAGKQQP